METIFWVLKMALFALGMTAAFFIFYKVILTYLEIKKSKREVIRKMNVLKSLELYWLENKTKKEKNLTEEINILNKIADEAKNEEIFLNLLKSSNISYCYEYYTKLSKTNYAILQIRSTEIIMRLTGRLN